MCVSCEVYYIVFFLQLSALASEIYSAHKSRGGQEYTQEPSFMHGRRIIISLTRRVELELKEEVHLWEAEVKR